MSTHKNILSAFAALTMAVGFSGVAGAQTARVLNNFDTDAEGWITNFANGLTVSAPTHNGSGGITFSVTGDGTNNAGFSDAFNNDGGTVAYAPGAGCVDLFGLDAVEFDLALTTSGTAATESLNIFMQAGGQDFAFLSFPISVTSDGTPTTVSADLTGETEENLEAVPIWGIQATPPAGITWTFTLTEVRSVGAGATERYLGKFDDTSAAANNGLEGWLVNFNAGGMVGGTSGTDPGLGASGIVHNPSAGVDGSIEITLQNNAGAGGVAISAQARHANTDFRSRPVDLSNYDMLEIVVAADSTDSSTTFMQVFAQTNGFGFTGLGAQAVNIPDGGAFQTYTFDLTSIPSLDLVDRIGIQFGEPVSGQNALVQLDTFRFFSTVSGVENWQMYD